MGGGGCDCHCNEGTVTIMGYCHWYCSNVAGIVIGQCNAFEGTVPFINLRAQWLALSLLWEDCG